VREDWGTADEYFDTLFEHFLRIDESPNRQFGGTRLGLVICGAKLGLAAPSFWFTARFEKGDPSGVIASACYLQELEEIGSPPFHGRREFA